MGVHVTYFNPLMSFGIVYLPISFRKCRFSMETGHACSKRKYARALDQHQYSDLKHEQDDSARC